MAEDDVARLYMDGNSDSDMVADEGARGSADPAPGAAHDDQPGPSSAPQAFGPSGLSGPDRFVIGSPEKEPMQDGVGSPERAPRPEEYGQANMDSPTVSYSSDVEPDQLMVGSVEKKSRRYRQRLRKRNRCDIAEFYSPPRVAAMAVEYGLKPGFSMDLDTGWDFRRAQDRKKALEELLCTEPHVLIGSPPCTDFSVIQNINRDRMGEVEWQRRKIEAMDHLEFACEMYIKQAEQGRVFVHEHPATASSWRQRCIRKVLEKTGACIVEANMCAFGMTTTSAGVTGLACKPTWFMTNSPALALELSRPCTNKNGDQPQHEHVHLEGARAKQAQVYPPELCKAFCRGAAKAVETKRQNRPVDLFLVDAANFKHFECPPEEANEWASAWDDVSGEALDPEEVVKARAEEIVYFNKMKVYHKVPIAQCWARTGKRPIPVRWVDINKGDKARPNHRSRLVAKDIKKNARPDLFAATPPLEALKTVISMAARGKKGTEIMVNDVKRAYFYAPAVREIYVDLCDEDRGVGEEELCGLLQYSMYGTRDASQNWQVEFTNTLVENGFVGGKSSPCLFTHKERGISTFVHGDDYVSAAEGRQLKWLEGVLKAKYDIKTTLLGPDETDAKEVTVLNRLIAWVDGQGITYEADPRHAQIMVKEILGIDLDGVELKGTATTGTSTSTTTSTPTRAKSKSVKPAATPGIRNEDETIEAKLREIEELRRKGKPKIDGDGKGGPDGDYSGAGKRSNLSKSMSEWGFADVGNEYEDDKLDDDELMGPAETTQYRALSARGNFLALDRVDIIYAVKEISRKMSAPCKGDWARLERLAKYLLGKPRLVMRFDFVDDPSFTQEARVFTDTDWAGCRRTRRSTTGGCIMWGPHLIRAWSTTQAVVALSSGEAELYGVIRASQEGLGFQSMLKDFGIKVPVSVAADASAALGVVRRKGLGKLRHIETNFLWVQDVAAGKKIEYVKQPGSENPSDICTKHVARDLCETHCKAMACGFVQGKSEQGFSIGLVEAMAAEDVILETWRREDLGSRYLRRPGRGGPNIKDVLQRNTIRTADGMTILEEDARDMNERDPNHEYFGKPTDITTEFLYLSRSTSTSIPSGVSS